MFGAYEQAVFAKLNLPCPAVAVKFCRNRSFPAELQWLKTD